MGGNAPHGRARRAVLEAVARWKRWRAQPPSLLAPEPPLQEMRDTMGQMVEPDPEPDPVGSPGARRIKPHVAPDRRISIEEKDMRHGRKSSAKTCNGFKEHFALDLDSTVTGEGVVCPAHAPAPEAGELLAETLEQGPGLLPLAIDLGDMASPRMAPWAAQGVHMLARPWPQGGDLCPKNDCTLDCGHETVICPQGETVPMLPGRDAQCPARACEACPVRAQCPTARLGQGRSLPVREDEPCQQTLRAQIRTKRGRASLRNRTAVEHAISHQFAHQGRRARSKGLRKNQFDGRRHAAVSNLQVAARYAEERRLAS